MDNHDDSKCNEQQERNSSTGEITFVEALVRRKSVHIIEIVSATVSSSSLHFHAVFQIKGHLRNNSSEWDMRKVRNESPNRTSNEAA